MKKISLLWHAAVATTLLGLPATHAAQSSPSQDIALSGLHTAELPRVTRVVDLHARATVQDSHLALIDQMNPVSAVADTTPMNHMQLVLKRSAQRQQAFNTLTADLHDPRSPKFHHWLTPQQVGDNFGVLDADIAAATSWLTAQGFTVHGVYPNKLQIDFSGTAGQVRQAFNTQLGRYAINGQTHVANTSDISIPAALSQVVTGVVGLNDFRPKPMSHAELAHFNPQTKRFEPASTPAATGKPGIRSDAVYSPNTSYLRLLVPYDMTMMYGVQPLHLKGITGKGITIALVEGANMVPSDWTNFRNQFGMGGGSFTQIQPQAPGMANCVNPGVATATNESFETLMDAEWASAMAPNAHIVVASCSDANTANSYGGVYTAAANLINGANRPNIISASYGNGESETDSASKAAVDLLWAQADVEGISVFVSSGDAGTHINYNRYYDTIINGVGISANSLATSANVTAVGGTDLADWLDRSTSQYFGNVNVLYGSALSYVPEIPWNASCGNGVLATSMGYPDALSFCKQQLAFDPSGYLANSIGASGAPSTVVRKPAWQRLVYNAAKDQSRDIPDVALFAGSYQSFYGNYATYALVCTASNPCTPGFTSTVYGGSGTSLSAPLFAGIQALIDQSLSDAGLSPNQGNAAPTLYALAAKEYGDPSAPATSLAGCNANLSAKTSACVFHNVTRGGISTQCVQHPGQITPNCYFYALVPSFQGKYPLTRLGLTSLSSTSYQPAYPAQPGWSFAAGLGSVNASNLLAAWKSFVGVP
jgi:subtilase family serine protease